MAPERSADRKGKVIGWLGVRSGWRMGASHSLNRNLSPAEVSSLLGGDSHEVGAVVVSGLLLQQKEGASQELVKAVLVPEGLVWRHRLTRRVLLTSHMISVTHEAGAQLFELHGFAMHPVSNIGRRLVHVSFRAASEAEAETWVQGFKGLGTLITTQEEGAAAGIGGEAEKALENGTSKSNDGPIRAGEEN
jgi:hypothetical protein